MYTTFSLFVHPLKEIVLVRLCCCDKISDINNLKRKYLSCSVSESSIIIVVRVWHSRAVQYLADRKQRVRKGPGPGTTFKGTPPVSYFLQLDPTS
jgi:hypothetical protein